MIDLYTWATPNGYKVSIMLEACGFNYTVHPINILGDEQFAPDFLRISPNNKIPAIVDSNGPDGEPLSLFESGAILIYLAEKSGLFLPTEPRARYDVLQWLMWQMGGFGPMLGQSHHFNVFARADVPYARRRYTEEGRRLWRVLNERLDGRDYVCDEISIADFAIYPWACRYAWQQIDPADFPNVQKWMQHLDSIDYVKKGMSIPS